MSCANYFPAQWAPPKEEVLTAIKPNTLVHITLRDHRIVESMKVNEIDSVRMIGYELVTGKRIIPIKDIQEIQILQDGRGENLYQVGAGSRIKVRLNDGKILIGIKVIERDSSTIRYSRDNGNRGVIRTTDVAELWKSAPPPGLSTATKPKVIAPLAGGYVQNERYRWDKVNVRLNNGKRIRGRLLFITEDSLVMYSQFRTRLRYSDISVIGIHRKGAGAEGAMVGGAIGGVLFYSMISDTFDSSAGTFPNFNYNYILGGGFIGIGIFIGGGAGALISSSNKGYPIDGNKEKFVAFVNRIAYK